MVSFALCFTGAAMSADELEYDLDIPKLSLDEALKSLARQVDVQLLFPFDLVRTLNANPVKGRYTLAQALAILLEDTGLAGDLTGSGVITISRVTSVSAPEARVGGVLNINKKAGLSATLAAVFSIGAGAQDVDTLTETAAEKSIVTGRVTDARTGANLKGAKVTIEATGQWTSTNDLGEYRFASVPTGRTTLAVSFLGYGEQSTIINVGGESVSQDFQLRGGSEIEEIVVFGQRSARAQALNLERTADNFTTVISSDHLGQFPGTTISDSLRVAPGVAFEIDPNTGEGRNVIIRGLEPGFNQVTLNGVRLTNDLETTRTSNLSNILTESIESVTINKTLLPSQDGSGTGGLIEIETKSPLDRDRRFAQFSVEGTERGEGFGRDRIYGGTLSGVFGSRDDLGISVSAQFRDQEIKRLGHRPQLRYGEYLPAGVSSQLSIDPTVTFPFENGARQAFPTSSEASSAERSSENLTIGGSIEKQFATHTNLRLDYSRTQVTTTDLNRNLVVDGIDAYFMVPIEELGGEERFAFIAERPADGPFPGVYVNLLQGVSYRPDNEQDTDTLSFRGSTNVDNWSFDYGAGYSRLEGERSNFSFGIALSRDALFNPLSASDVDPDTWARRRAGLLVSVYDPVLPGQDNRFIFPSLTQSYFDRINNPALYELSGPTLGNGVLSSNTIRDSNDRLSFNASARYNLDAKWIDYIELGVFREETDFTIGINPSEVLRGWRANDVMADELGLEFGPGILDLVGLGVDGFDLITESSAISLLNNLDDLTAAGLLTPADAPLASGESDEETSEIETAAYLEAKMNWGDFEVIGGARLVSVDVDTKFVTEPSGFDENGAPIASLEDFIGIIRASESQTDILPRILVNYRPSEDLIFRAGYFTSVNRPQIRALNRGQVPRLILVPIFGPNSDQPLLTVSQGNPNLKPSYTDNWDASAEYYTDNVGAIKLSVFYKEIEDSFTLISTEGGLELAPDALVLPPAPEFQNLPDNLFVQVSQPVNNPERIDLWGAELSIERWFTKLPGVFGGLGVFGNIAYADSSQTFRIGTTTNEEGFVEVDRPLPGAPEYTGTAAITYSKYGIDGSLTYSWQDRRLISIQDFGLDEYNGEFETLDLRVAYNGTFGDREYWVFFEGRDLLRSEDEATTTREAGGVNGTPTYYGLDDRYFGGRSFTLGASFTF